MLALRRAVIAHSDFIIGREVDTVKNGSNYSILAAAVLLSIASFSSQAMEIEVIPKGAPYPAGLGISAGSPVCAEGSGDMAAQAMVSENNGMSSAMVFNKVTSVASAGSSIALLSASEANPVSLSNPDCRYITMTIDRGTVQDGEYDLADPDSAVKLVYVHVFSEKVGIPGVPGGTILASYPVEQGRAHVVHDKSADHFTATFDFSTTIEPLPPQWGGGYPSAYPVSITSGSFASRNRAIASCEAAWERSPARGSRQCQRGSVLGGTDCSIQTTCRTNPDQNEPAIPAYFGGSPEQVQRLRWNGKILTPN
jgi:hypothetical protein